MAQKGQMPLTGFLPGGLGGGFEAAFSRAEIWRFGCPRDYHSSLEAHIRLKGAAQPLHVHSLVGKII